MAKQYNYEDFLLENKAYLYRLEHNTFVVESMNLLYMDTPKTAGTSLKTKLAESIADYMPPANSASLETVSEMFIHDRVINPLKPITAFPYERQKNILFSDRWNRVCVVRNPYNRVFSAWFSKLLLRQPGFDDSVPGYQIPEKISSQKEIYLLFEDFIAHLSEFGCQSDPHWDLQTRLLFKNSIVWAKIFRFENLQKELLENKLYFGGREIILDRLNLSGFVPDWNSISSNTKELIQNIYKEDFAHYGYPSTPPDTQATGDTLVAYVNGVSARNSRINILIDLHRQDKLQLDALHEELETLRDEKRALKELLTEIESRLTSMLSSRSWKITRPLRAIMELIKRLGKLG